MVEGEGGSWEPDPPLAESRLAYPRRLGATRGVCWWLALFYVFCFLWEC